MDNMLPNSSRRLAASKRREGGSQKNTEDIRKLIHSFRGILKRKAGDKPFAEEWAEYKREEKELEERNFQRLAASGMRTKSPD